MNWSAIGAIGSIIIAGTAVIGLLNNTDNVNLESKDNIINKSKSSIINQSADEIIQWYRNIKKAGNGLEAQELSSTKYIGKYITINGSFRNIEASIAYPNGATVILNSTINEKNMLIANFTNKNEVYSLNKDSVVSITGKVYQLDENLIAIKDSKIINVLFSKSLNVSK